MNTSLLARRVGHALKKQSPTILTGTAVVGVIATVVLAVKATPAAEDALISEEASRFEKLEAETEDPKTIHRNDVKLSRQDVVKVTWRLYIPTALTGTATIACIIGANKIGLSRNAALIAGYAVLDDTFRTYRDKVVESFGQTKADKVHDAAVAEMATRKPVENREVIITDGGEQLCWESFSGRYFRSDVESIRRAENDLNRQVLQGEMYIGLNEFYDAIGLEHTNAGDLFGWNVDRPIEVIFTTHLSTEGKACLSLAYKHMPFPDYGKF